jgi:hypothetical protein
MQFKIYMVIDIVLVLPQHGNPSSLQHDSVFVDIFAIKGSGGSTDQTFQPTLKIRRLGPLVHTMKDGIALWITDRSVEVYVF